MYICRNFTINIHYGNKMQRLEVLRVILSCNEMGSREEILKELAKNGWAVTQATLSRDLTKLHATEILGNGGCWYVCRKSTLPTNGETRCGATVFAQYRVLVD